MICEKCGISYDKDYRKQQKTKSRFCSKSCANSRIWSDEDKKLKSDLSKGLWKDESHVIKMKEKYKRLRGNSITFEQRKKASISQKKRRDVERKKLIESNNYESMSRGFRRKTLLEKANYTCESCHNDTWLDEPIWLEIHHKDGNNKNNKRDNLIVICLNCHSVIDENYRFRGRKH